MLKQLKRLARGLVPPPDGAAAGHDEITIELATAVLLVEVMRAEGPAVAQARAVVSHALRERFELSPEGADRLADRAERAVKRSTDFYAYTSLLNERFGMAAKVHLVDLMARVAYADGRLGDHERHIVWRIADLLHVPHGAYVNAPPARAGRPRERPGHRRSAAARFAASARPSASQLESAAAPAGRPGWPVPRPLVRRRMATASSRA